MAASLTTRAQVSPNLAKYAITNHKSKSKRKHILCPCLNCQKWRASFLRPGIFYAIQRVIKEEVLLNLAESIKLGEYLDGKTSGVQGCTEENRGRRLLKKDGRCYSSFPNSTRIGRREEVESTS